MMANPILDRAGLSQQTAPIKDEDSLLAVEEALRASTSRITSSIQDLESKASQTKVATDSISRSLSDIASASQVVATVQNNANLQAQNANIQANRAAGGVDMQANMVAELTEDSDDLDALLERRQDIFQEEHTGIGIIDGIINSFRSIQTNLEVRAATAKRDQTLKQIQDITGAQESFARINNLTKETINAASIEAGNKAIKSEYDIKAREAEIKNLNLNAAAMADIMQADASLVSSLVQKFRLEGEAEQRQLAREQQDFAREQMQFTRERWEVELPAAKVALEQAQIALEDSKLLSGDRRAAASANFRTATKRFNDALALQDQVVDSIQRAQSTMGLAIEPAETVVFKLEDPVTKARYIKLQEMGSVETPILGLTPFEAQSNRAAIDPNGTGRRTKGSKLLDLITSEQLKQYQASPTGVPKDEEVIKADYNRTADAVMSNLSKNIERGNPFEAPPMTVLSQVPAVKNSSLFKKILEPLGLKEVEPQRIVDAALAGIISGTISAEEAAQGIETLFESAAAINNTQDGGFSRVGLPNQSTYNVRIDRQPTAFEVIKQLPSESFPGTFIPKLFKSEAETGGAFLEEVFGEFWFEVDLMNETRVKNLLVKLLTEQPPATTPATQQ